MTEPDVPWVLVDTSTLFTASYRKRLTLLAAEGTIVAIWSPWIVAELNRVLTWAWLDRHGDSPQIRRACSAAAKIMMLAMEPNFLTIAPRPPYPPAWPHLDTGDHPVWAAAKEARAAYVVSENTHDFPPADSSGQHHYEGIEYLRCAAFPRRLEDLGSGS